MRGVYTCREHCIPGVLLDVWLSAATRRMLAYAEWESVDAGQELIDRLVNERAA